MAEKALNVTGNSAARVAAHREKFARLDVSVKPGMHRTIDELAAMYDCPKVVVVRSLTVRLATSSAYIAVTPCYKNNIYGICNSC